MANEKLQEEIESLTARFLTTDLFGPPGNPFSTKRKSAFSDEELGKQIDNIAERTGEKPKTIAEHFIVALQSRMVRIGEGPAQVISSRGATVPKDVLIPPGLL